MIKVLYIRSSFDPGGTESLLLNLFNYPQKEIQFHYAFLKDGSLIDKLNSNYNKYYKVFRKTKIDLRTLERLYRILKENEIYIVHTHQMFELFYAFLLKLLNPKLKIFHTIHGYFDTNKKWAERLEMFLIYFTERTFTVSYAAKDILKKKGYPANKISVLYNAVQLPSRASSKELEAFKIRIKYKSSDFIAGMIGNFVWWKDQITIVKAFNFLRKEIPELKIIFIGKESDFSEKCKALLKPEDIDERVFFLGALENASKYLSLFDLFIMSTIMDTFGIVVIEALMCKIPVLASDIDVMKELSRNGKYFDLFKTKNYISLSNHIRLYYNINITEKKDFVHKNILNKFSYKYYVYKLMKVYSI